MNKPRSIRKSAFLAIEPLEDRSLPAVFMPMPLAPDADAVSISYTLETDTVAVTQDGEGAQPRPHVPDKVLSPLESAIKELEHIQKLGEAEGATAADKAGADLAKTVLQEYQQAVKALAENKDPKLTMRLEQAKNEAEKALLSRRRYLERLVRSDEILRNHGVKQGHRAIILKMLEFSANRISAFSRQREPVGTPSDALLKHIANRVYDGNAEGDAQNRSDLYDALFRAWRQPK